jgi:anti-sigma regulatory factor (Ser/Thr protein kinase)
MCQRGFAQVSSARRADRADMGIETATGTRHERDAANGIAPRAPGRAPARFEHSALYYRDAEGFLAGTLPFIVAGLDAGEAVAVAVSKPRAESIERSLGAERERVRFVDVCTLARNPGRIIAFWRDFLDSHAPDGLAARGVSELIWPGRTPAELSECERTELLLNPAFADSSAWRLLCAYDLAALDQLAIETARRRHPSIERERGSCLSESYEPDGPGGVFDGELAAPGAAPERISFDAGDLASVRARVASRAAQARLAGDRVEDLVLAINELVTNSVQYGDGGGQLLIWQETELLICEVRDRGRIEDPLVGRVRPARDQSGGRGLWLVNQLCDLVQIRVTPAGTVVRVHMRLA